VQDIDEGYNAYKIISIFCQHLIFIKNCNFTYLFLLLLLLFSDIKKKLRIFCFLFFKVQIRFFTLPESKSFECILMIRNIVIFINLQTYRWSKIIDGYWPIIMLIKQIILLKYNIVTIVYDWTTVVKKYYLQPWIEQIRIIVTPISYKWLFRNNIIEQLFIYFNFCYMDIQMTEQVPSMMV